MTYPNQAPQQGGVMHEKNPNGGYLNPSKFGGMYGSADLTVAFLQELLQKAQQSGGVAKLDVKLGEQKTNSKGNPYQRVTFKHYEVRPQQGIAPQPQPQPYNGGGNAAPVGAPLNDSIPF